MYFFILFLIVINWSSCTQENKEYEEVVEEYLNELRNNSKNDIRVFPNIKMFHGAVLPNVEKRTLKGQTIDFRKLQNEFTIINTWFLECKPCIEEIPVLNKLNSLDNLDVISICKNDSIDIDTSINCSNIKYKIIADQTPFLKDTLNKTFGYPTNLLVDKNGVIQSLYKGIREDSKEYRHILEMTGN